MNYAIGVVAHPSRSRRAAALGALVGADLIVIDAEGRGERWCHQETLAKLVLRDCDHVVLLEDDAVPCHNFRGLLSAYLVEAGDALVSLYLGTGAWSHADQFSQRRAVARLTARADAEGATWIEAASLWHGVGVALPIVRSASLLAYMRASRYPSDGAMSRWARANGVPVRYTWPSLVDHADGEPVGGKRRQVPRRAVRTHPMSI